MIASVNHDEGQDVLTSVVGAEHTPLTRQFLEYTFILSTCLT